MLRLSITNIIYLVFLLNTVKAEFYTPTDRVKEVNSYPDIELTGGSIPGTSHTGELAVLILALGLASLFLFPIILCFRCCCTCMKCAPDPLDPESHYVNDNADTKYYKPKILTGLYYLTCIAGFVMAHFMWMATDGFSASFDNASSAFEDIKLQFTDVKTDCTVLSSDIATKSSRVDSMSGACSAAKTELQDALTTLGDTNDAIFSIAKPIPDYMSDAQDMMDQGDTFQSTVLYAAYCGIMAVIGIYLLLNFFESKFGLRLMMPFTWIVVTILTVVCCVELQVLMYSASFCMDPTQEMLDSMSQSSSLWGIINDTMVRNNQGQTCMNGKTELQNDVYELNNTLNSILNITAIFTNSGSCSSADDTILGEVQTTFKSFQTLQVTNLDDAVKCETLHNLFSKLLEKAFCTNLTDGLYYFWLSKHTTALFLFILMVLGTITWQYFGDVEEDKGDFLAMEENNNGAVSGGITISSGRPPKEAEMISRDATRGRFRGVF